LAESEAEVRGKFSRWWWLPEWFWQGIFIIVTRWILERIGRRMRKLDLRSLLFRIGRNVLRSSPVTVPMIAGFALMEQYVGYLGTPLFLRIGIGLAAVVAVWVITLRKQAQHSLHGIQRLKNFSSGLSQGMGVAFNFLIGGILNAFFVLAVGLLPYVSNPWVLLIFGIYAMFLASVVLMKRISSKLGGRYRKNLPRGIWV